MTTNQNFLPGICTEQANYIFIYLEKNHLNAY